MGNSSGQLESDDRFGSLTVGAIVGGTGSDSGILTGDRFGKLTVRGDLLGGVGDRSGRIFVTSGDLPALTVGGSIRSGTGASTGGVFVSGALGPVTVGGEIVGTAANPVTIAAGGDVPFGGSSDIGITSLSVKGGVTQARILAGYDEGVTARNADAVIGKVTVGGDWIASSIAAGVAANGEGGFGTADDTLISGGGTTNDAALTSRIGSIAIKGQLLGTVAGGDAFGFVAEQIGSVKVGAFSEPLAATVDAQPLGATGDSSSARMSSA